MLRGSIVDGRNNLPKIGLHAFCDRIGGREVASYAQSAKWYLCINPLTDPISQPTDLRSLVVIGAIVLYTCGIGVKFERLDDAAPQNLCDKLMPICVKNEKPAINLDAGYVYAPVGIGRSKMMAVLWHQIGAKAKVRNLQTMWTIIDRASGTAAKVATLHNRPSQYRMWGGLLGFNKLD